MAASNDNPTPICNGNTIICPNCSMESLSWCFTCIRCGFDFDENRMPLTCENPDEVTA